MSQNTTSAPVYSTAFALDTQVKDGTITLSPFVTPIASRPR